MVNEGYYNRKASKFLGFFVFSSSTLNTSTNHLVYLFPRDRIPRRQILPTCSDTVPLTGLPEAII